MSSNNHKLTTETFVQRAHLVHGNRYDYSQTVYTNVRTPVTVICPAHGPWQAAPKVHYGTGGKPGSQCPECDRLKRMNDGSKVICQAAIIHPNLDFCGSIFTGMLKLMNVVCPWHGNFSIRPNNLIALEQGCHKCADENQPGGYNQAVFTTNRKLAEQPGILYVVNFAGLDEHFVKIGITKNSIHRRFGGQLPQYEKTTVCEYHATLEECFYREQQVLGRFRPLRYTPKSGKWSREHGRSRYSVHGWTECFKPELLIEPRFWEMVNES